jgi:hypothetical protein
MSDLSERIAKLSPEKRALLEQRLLKKGATPPATTVRRRQPGDPSPLSFAQQRLWFLDQWEPGTSVYNAALALRLTGELRLDALQAAISGIVERHEVLRTTYPSENGVPRQVVLPAARVPLRVLDLRTVSAPVREAGAMRLLVKEIQRPFQLARAVMLRPSLLRLADDDALLALATHHIASDGWSRGVLFHELAVLYEAFSAGKSSPLPPLPVQYADYALWQQEWLRGPNLERLVSFWKGQLDGALQVLELPTDKLRPPVPSFRGARLNLALSQGLYESLRSLARGQGVTLFMALLASFKTLLWCWTGQEDILAGSPIAGRNHVETEPLIGFFVNTLVLRTDLRGNPTFRQLLGRVRERTLGAYAHQEMPFEKLVEVLKPTRNPGRNPLFQVNFRAQTELTPPPRLCGLVARNIDFDPGISRFDLAAELWATPEFFGGYIEYATDLFERPTIERLAGDFQRLLSLILAQPDSPLQDLRKLLRAAGEGRPPLRRRATAPPQPQT